MTDTRAGRVAGRVAFITGAGSGIGRATALAFAEQGAAVAAFDNAEKDLHETARLIEDRGGRALPVLCDVTRSDDVAAAVTATVQRFGRLDSGAGVIGIAGQAAYAASKHAVIGLTKAAALDYAAAGVRINAVCPGIIETPMMDRFSGGTDEGRQRVIGQEPVGRMGRPEEIASAVLWQCSDLGAFTVGHALVVDGGQTVGL
jgi:NAD(P)-dependent dehydrogenase (short-subunit alcohol dehydrogenase family)